MVYVNVIAVSPEGQPQLNSITNQFWHEDHGVCMERARTWAAEYSADLDRRYQVHAERRWSWLFLSNDEMRQMNESERPDLWAAEHGNETSLRGDADVR